MPPAPADTLVQSLQREIWPVQPLAEGNHSWNIPQTIPPTMPTPAETLDQSQPPPKKLWPILPDQPHLYQGLLPNTVIQYNPVCSRRISDQTFQLPKESHLQESQTHPLSHALFTILQTRKCIIFWH